MLEKCQSYSSFCLVNLDLPKITMRLRFHDILILLPKDCHNSDISQANFKILVSNHIYTFSPSILNQFPGIFFKNISSKGRNVQKIQIWENPVFGLQTQFEPWNLHLSLILRTVLETSDWVEFKTVPKHEDYSKIGWVMGLQKYFFWKVEDVQSDQNWENWYKMS